MVWDKGCEGVWGSRLGQIRATRLTLNSTVYLERSDSILRRNSNKLSAPLEQEAEAREKQPGVRSIVTHPALYTVLEQIKITF